MSDNPSVALDDSARPTTCGMELLRQVRSYAGEFQRSPWDFAVEIAALRSSGFTDNDLRWFVLNGYLEHAHELPTKNGKTRQFRQFGSLTFTKHSCFVPTDDGVQLVELGDVQANDAPGDGDRTSELPANGAQAIVQPIWDAAKQQLCVGQEVVKTFKHPSTSQTVILSAFQEANWPERIDDPLAQPGLSLVQTQLQETIDSLNGNQRKCLIQFAHDESGGGIIWKRAEQDL